MLSVQLSEVTMYSRPFSTTRRDREIKIARRSHVRDTSLSTSLPSAPPMNGTDTEKRLDSVTVDNNAAANNADCNVLFNQSAGPSYVFGTQSSPIGSAGRVPQPLQHILFPRAPTQSLLCNS